MPTAGSSTSAPGSPAKTATRASTRPAAATPTSHSACDRSSSRRPSPTPRGCWQFFAAELGRLHDVPHWQSVHAAYRQRTRQLYDPRTGRFRDWLIAEERFSPASAQLAGDGLYWGIDANRYSAQSLTPLLIGEPLDEDEVWRHARRAVDAVAVVDLVSWSSRQPPRGCTPASAGSRTRRSTGSIG